MERAIATLALVRVGPTPTHTNVRKLEAAIQRAVAMCKEPRISSNHLAPILNHHRQNRGNGGTPGPHLPMGIRPLREALEEPEMRIIVEALRAFDWNRQETARVLNINRTTLYKKMKKYGLLGPPGACPE
jgi:two-component system, NtrC family, response regulator HydG